MGGDVHTDGTGVALTAILSPGTEGEVIVGTLAGGAITLRYDLDFGTASPDDDDERLLFTR